MTAQEWGGRYTFSADDLEALKKFNLLAARVNITLSKVMIVGEQITKLWHDFNFFISLYSLHKKDHFSHELFSYAL
ncbi:hypothetical protein [Paenibacillus sp. FSL L8-0333]|uniref:hypothetical protein n=1 Tax=unclassified Paenibacillus TaxID=185978 RepID=UPI0030D51EA6